MGIWSVCNFAIYYVIDSKRHVHMNLSIYLPQKLVSKLSQVAHQQQSSKNAIVIEALEEWLSHHYPSAKWPSNFFDFQAVKETPDFSSYRSELRPPKEDIF